MHRGTGAVRVGSRDSGVKPLFTPGAHVSSSLRQLEGVFDVRLRIIYGFVILGGGGEAPRRTGVAVHEVGREAWENQ
jgi:hypothetical protein